MAKTSEPEGNETGKPQRHKCPACNGVMPRSLESAKHCKNADCDWYVCERCKAVIDYFKGKFARAR